MEPETVDLEAEHERIVADIETLSGTLADLERGTERFDALDARASRLDVHRRGVEHALEAWETETITLRPLTIGDDVRLDEHTNSPGERRLWQIAIGTADAPYLEHDAEDYPDVSMDTVGRTVATIDQEVPIATGRWLQSRIDGVSAVGNRTGEGSYATSLAAKSSQQPSTTE